MALTLDDIKREKERRKMLKQNPAYSAPDQSNNQQYQEPEPESKFMSGVQGFNTGVERLTHGVLQPLLKNNETFKRAVNRRESGYESSRQQNPGSTLTGEFLGNVAIGLPFSGGGTAAVGKIPGLAKALQNSPYLKNIIGGGLGGGVMGGAEYVNPEESRLKNAGLGAGIGAGFGVAAPAVGKVVDVGARGIKAAAGVANESWKSLRRQMGSEKHINEKILENYTNAELSLALKNQAAASKLGIELTPAEASKNRIGGAYEGSLGTSPEGERAMYEFKKARKLKEEEAIENLKRGISPSGANANEEGRNVAQKIITKKEKALQKKARPYYEKAESKILPANVINNLTKNGSINKAWKDVLEDTDYASEIEGFAPNSVKVLDEVKKRLDGQIGTAKKGGDNNLARILRKAKDKLVSQLDKVAPEYKKARSIYSTESPLIDMVRKRQVGKIANLKDSETKKISNIIFDPTENDIKALERIGTEFRKESPKTWDKIIRNAMEKKVGTKYKGKHDFHGTNFFNQILADETTYKQFHTALKHKPEQQKALELMKTGFKDLINEPTVKGAAALANTSMDKSRSTAQDTAKFITNASGGRYDKGAIEILTTDKWKKSFFDAMMERTPNEKARKLSALLDKASKQKKVAKSALTTGVVGQSTSTKGRPFIETENYEVYD